MTETARSDSAPSPLQRLRLGLRAWRAERILAGAMRRLLELRGRPPAREHFDALWRGFGNEGWSASVELLDELSARVARANAGVLECGSGLTTMLLGALTRERRLPIVSLEHHPEWFARMRDRLARFDLSHVDLQLRPLASYGDYDWYATPELPADRRFDLVLCDGPPGDTKGGRHGLLPRMRDRFAKGCVLIVDDTHRAEDDAVVTRWMESLPGATRRRRGQFTIVECP